MKMKWEELQQQIQQTRIAIIATTNLPLLRLPQCDSHMPPPLCYKAVVTATAIFNNRIENA